MSTNDNPQHLLAMGERLPLLSSGGTRRNNEGAGGSVPSSHDRNNHHAVSASRMKSILGMAAVMVAFVAAVYLGAPLATQKHSPNSATTTTFPDTSLPAEGSSRHVDTTIFHVSSKEKLLGESETNNTILTPEAQADWITSLPGITDHALAALGFRMFSGYLTVSARNGRHIFYWYVESQGNPTTDPVLFWTNGGPGCSGLLGFGQEHGPFVISHDGYLTPNPYSGDRINEPPGHQARITLPNRVSRGSTAGGKQSTTFHPQLHQMIHHAPALPQCVAGEPIEGRKQNA